MLSVYANLILRLRVRAKRKPGQEKGDRMRKLTAIVAITATVAAGLPPAPVLAQAQVVPASVTPEISVDVAQLIPSTINAFPNGGDPLKLAISDLIVKYPDLAASLAAYLKNEPSLTPEQKTAIFAGLADGLNRLGIVAQVSSGMDPLLLALLLGGAAAAGFGVYELTKSTSSSSTVSPNWSSYAVGNLRIAVSGVILHALEMLACDLLKSRR
jgi:hypothetical protein